MSGTGLRLAVVIAVTLSIGLSGCGRQGDVSTEPVPVPTQSTAADTAQQPTPAATVDLTEIESELDGLDSVLNQSTSDLSDAKDAAAQEQ
jgi:predicted small lipoprotein YifL